MTVNPRQDQASAGGDGDETGAGTGMPIPWPQNFPSVTCQNCDTRGVPPIATSHQHPFEFRNFKWLQAHASVHSQSQVLVVPCAAQCVTSVLRVVLSWVPQSPTASGRLWPGPRQAKVFRSTKHAEHVDYLKGHGSMMFSASKFESFE